MMAEPHTHDQRLHLHPVSPDDWESHRDVRLAMLQDAPDAFWFTYADEAAYDEADWRERIEGAWLVQARDASGVLGSAGLGSHWEPERATTATLFGMYVAPRGARTWCRRGPGPSRPRAGEAPRQDRGRARGDELQRGRRGVVRAVRVRAHRRGPRPPAAPGPARDRDGPPLLSHTVGQSVPRCTRTFTGPRVRSGRPVVRRWTHERHHRASPRRGRLGGLPFRPPRRTA